MGRKPDLTPEQAEEIRLPQTIRAVLGRQVTALRRLAAMAAVVASVQSAEAMDFSVDRSVDNVLVIFATGAIEKGDAERFRRFLVTLPDKRLSQRSTVLFNSPGGVLADALAIGALLERNKFITGVRTGGRCWSACVLAWAVGRIKFANSDTCIGVHTANANGGVDGFPKKPDAPDALPKKVRENIEGTANLDMATWLSDHGAPRIVTTKIFHTSAHSVYCLTFQDLVAWGVTMLP